VLIGRNIFHDIGAYIWKIFLPIRILLIKNVKSALVYNALWVYFADFLPISTIRGKYGNQE
jgi:hypothetical protein